MMNQADINAFMAYQADKSKQPAYQAAYQNSAPVLAQKKQNAGVKSVADGAKAVYDKGGDQALADYYLNADPKYAVRGQTNPAKLVKAGKTTFQDVAKQEQEEMKAAAIANAKSGNTGNELLYKNGEFNFALGGSGNSSSQPQSGGQTNTQSGAQTNTQQVQKKVIPYNPGEINFNPNWSNAKDKAQSFINKNAYDFDSDNYSFNPNM